MLQTNDKSIRNKPQNTLARNLDGPSNGINISVDISISRKILNLSNIINLSKSKK